MKLLRAIKDWDLHFRCCIMAISGQFFDGLKMYLCNIYIPLCRALRVLVHKGNLVNGRGRDNARAEGECIIRPRPLTRLPECTKARNARQSGI